MFKYIFSSFISLFITASLFSQEVTIKPLLNVPVSYQLTINGELLHKNAKTTDKLSTFNFDQDLTLEIKQKENEVPEILITPVRTRYKHDGFGFAFSFDSNSILESNFIYLKQFRSNWGKPFHIPLTMDEKYIQEHSDIHSYLDKEQITNYYDFVKSALDYIKNGEKYSDGGVLWKYEEETQSEKIQGGAKVAKITSSEVLIEALIKGLFKNIFGDGSYAELTFKADNTIQRSNALLRSGNGALSVKVLGKNNGFIPYIGEGELHINGSIKLTSEANK